jgi:hypothetical protein
MWDSGCKGGGGGGDWGKGRRSGRRGGGGGASGRSGGGGRGGGGWGGWRGGLPVARYRLPLGLTPAAVAACPSARGSSGRLIHHSSTSRLL